MRQDACFINDSQLTVLTSMSVSVTQRSSNFDDRFVGFVQIQMLKNETDNFDRQLRLRFEKQKPVFDDNSVVAGDQAVNLLTDGLIIALKVSQTTKTNLVQIPCFALFLPKKLHDVAQHLIERKMENKTFTQEEDVLSEDVMQELTTWQTQSPNIRDLDCRVTEDHSRVVIGFLLSSSWNSSHYIDLLNEAVFITL